MPRKARLKSSTGIYHIVFRGINKQRIFEDDEDHLVFLKKLKTYKETSEYEIYAYCLMANHVHLLMKEGSDPLGIIFRRIGSSYVFWYNRKHNRLGHLFQDRYKSEVVDTETYFLTAMRYIHQNPLKAGIVKNIQEYPWSSYNEYVQQKTLCNTSNALDLFSSNPIEAKKLWIDYNQTITDERCLEFNSESRIHDFEAESIINSLMSEKNLSNLQSLGSPEKNTLIRTMKEKGLSIRQIVRFTGFSFEKIRRM